MPLVLPDHLCHLPSHQSKSLLCQGVPLTLVTRVGTSNPLPIHKEKDIIFHTVQQSSSRSNLGGNERPELVNVNLGVLVDLEQPVRVLAAVMRGNRLGLDDLLLLLLWQVSHPAQQPVPVLEVHRLGFVLVLSGVSKVKKKKRNERVRKGGERKKGADSPPTTRS